MDTEKVIHSINELDEVAQWILDHSKERNVVVFKAPMGAGKTTLISVICKKMGVTDQVTSPTFAVINEYVRQSQLPVYHFDCYRLKNKEEAYDIGFEDYFYSDSYCFVEWPEIVSDLLPENTLVVAIEVLPNGNRKFTLK